jgi:hypothetical protein
LCRLQRRIYCWKNSPKMVCTLQVRKFWHVWHSVLRAAIRLRWRSSECFNLHRSPSNNSRIGQWDGLWPCNNRPTSAICGKNPKAGSMDAAHFHSRQQELACHHLCFFARPSSPCSSTTWIFLSWWRKMVPLRQFKAKEGMAEPRQAGNTPWEAWSSSSQDNVVHLIGYEGDYPS